MDKQRTLADCEPEDLVRVCGTVVGVVGAMTAVEIWVGDRRETICLPSDYVPTYHLPADLPAELPEGVQYV